jgi:geranylgeranyl pyrophosphate synthase
MVLAVSYALNGQDIDPSAENNNQFATASQKRLAEITEMIHTASLFHDDVIDKVMSVVVVAGGCS